MFDASPQLDCAGRILRLDVPRVMGIVNVTPDSFADGGEHATIDAAIARGESLREARALYRAQRRQALTAIIGGLLVMILVIAAAM